MFDKKVVVIIGISSSIGNVLEDLLTQKNAIVIGSYFNHKIDGENYYKCDVTNEESVKNFFNLIKNKYGKIDYLINMMTYSKDEDFENKSAEDFLDVVKVNLLGTFLTCKYGLKLMKTGVVINMSSLDGISTYSPISMDYCASKSGVINLTKNFALRLPNIKFYAVAPGWIDTKSTLEIEPKYLENELKRINQKCLLKKEEVARKIIEIMLNNELKSGSIITIEEN